MSLSFLSHLDFWLSRAVIFLFLATISEGVHVFPVFRLIQYTSHDQNFGSQRAGVNLLAGAWAPKESQDLSRRIVIVSYDQIDLETFPEIVNEKKAGGVLITLPKNDDNTTVPDSVQRRWKEIEKILLTTEFKIPLYFTFEDDALKHLSSVVTQVSSNTQELLQPMRDMYQLVVAAPEATVIQEINGVNFKGWLTGSQSGKEQQTLAVVASYDAIAAAPELAMGTDSNASGLTALFEMARLFSKLYNGYKTQGNYNLLFLVTGGGRLNSEGLRNWLATADGRLLDSIEFALCLDSILSPSDQDGLYLHVSKSPKEEKFQQIVGQFNATAKQFNVPFQVVHKKINISDPTIYWEHELFSRKRIFAATLSHFPSPSPGLQRSNILDRRSPDLTILGRNIRFVVESLSHQIYKLKKSEIEIFDGFLGVNTHFLRSWMETLTSFSRFQPYIPKTSPLYTHIEKILKDYTNEVTVQQFKVEGAEIKYYTSPANLTMSAYKVKPFTFDFILFFLILGYLFSLVVALKGVQGAVGLVKNFLVPAQSKKKR